MPRDDRPAMPRRRVPGTATPEPDTDTATPMPDTDTPPNTPGFGVVLALPAAALLAIRRER